MASRNRAQAFRDELLTAQLDLMGLTSSVELKQKFARIQSLYENRIRDLDRELEREKFMSSSLLKENNQLKEELHLCNKAHEEAQRA